MRKILIMLIFSLSVAPLYGGSHRRGVSHSLTRGIVEILNSRAHKDTIHRKKKKKHAKRKKKRERSRRKNK